MPKLITNINYHFDEDYCEGCRSAYANIINIFKSVGYNSLREFEYFLQKLYIIILSCEDITYVELLIIWTTLLDKKEIKTLYNGKLLTVGRDKKFYDDECNFIDNFIMNMNLALLNESNLVNFLKTERNPFQSIYSSIQMSYKGYLINHGLINQFSKEDIQNGKVYKWLKQRFANYLTLVNKE